MRHRGCIATLFVCAGAAATWRFWPAARLWYVEGPLRAWQGVLRVVFGATRFPLAEAALLAFTVGAVVALVRRRGAHVARATCAIALLLCVTWLPLCAGGAVTAETHAEPDDTATIETRAEPDGTATIETRAEPDSALADYCVRHAREASDLRQCLLQDESGRALLPYSRESLLRKAAALSGSGVTPKYTRFPEAMSALGIAGWYCPLTGEAIVDATLPDALLPFACMHELAHASGVAGEAEANLAAYTACGQGDAAFRYSGTLNALWFGMRGLQASDQAAWQAVLADMDQAVLRDFRALNGLNEAQESWLSRAQDRITNGYIRFLGLTEYDAFPAMLMAKTTQLSQLG